MRKSGEIMYHTTQEGYKIWYESSGHGSGVLILHGLGGSTESMKPISFGLGDGFRKVLMDIPCHGRSDNFGINIHDLGREMVSLMRENGFDSFSGVGLSLGSILLEETMIDFGGALKNAVFISPTSRIDDVVVNKITGWATIPGQADEDAFSPKFLKDHREEIEAYDKVNPFIPERVIPILSEIFEFSLKGRFSNNPAMMIIGKYDTLFGERMIDDLVRAFPNSEYHILESGHAIHREIPDLASRMILQFLRKHWK